MAVPKKSIKTIIEQTPPSEAIPKTEPEKGTHETVSLTEAYAKHGSIVAKHGIIEFIDGQATVSTALAEELRQQGFVV